MSTLNSIRSLLYTVARLLGWINAAARGRLLQRVGRAYLGRRAGSAINRLFK